MHIKLRWVELNELSERDKVNLAGFHFNLAAVEAAAAAQRQNKEKRQNEFCNVWT